MSPLGGYGGIAGSALEMPRRSVNTLKPSGTLAILFLNELGPSNAAFDGPYVVQHGVGVVRVVSTVPAKILLGD